MIFMESEEGEIKSKQASKGDRTLRLSGKQSVKLKHGNGDFASVKQKNNLTFSSRKRYLMT